MATAGRTAPITKQVAITGTETHLGELFQDTTGKVRITVPKAAASSIWLGAKGVTASGANGGGEYPAGTCTQLPTTSLEGWYAISSAPVTITIEMATGGVDTPDWLDAGSMGTGGSSGAPSVVQGVNAGVPERLATFAEQKDQTTELAGIRAEQATAAKQDAIIAALRTPKTVDLKLVGGQWIVQLESTGGTPITSTTIGTVSVGASGEVALPLDLAGMGGAPATQIRVFGAGTLKVVHESPLVPAFPVAPLRVDDGEVVEERITSLRAILGDIDHVSISWGG